jgi:hypothetical protein
MAEAVTVERAAVVTQRRERNFPWHSPPHPHRHEGWYIVTGIIFELKFTAISTITAP